VEVLAERKQQVMQDHEAWSRLSWASGSFARLGIGEHAHDVALLHDQILDAIDLDFRPGPFAEQDPIAGLQIDGNELSGLVAPTRTDGNDLALLGLFLGSVRNDNPTGGPCLGFDALEHNTIVEWTELHIGPPSLFLFLFRMNRVSVSGPHECLLSSIGALLALVKCECQFGVSNHAVILLTF
jgi:hypothetical protein